MNQPVVRTRLRPRAQPGYSKFRPQRRTTASRMVGRLDNCGAKDIRLGWSCFRAEFLSGSSERLRCQLPGAIAGDELSTAATAPIETKWTPEPTVTSASNKFKCSRVAPIRAARSRTRQLAEQWTTARGFHGTNGPKKTLPDVYGATEKKPRRLRHRTSTSD
jgi:hypothetical protein